MAGAIRTEGLSKRYGDTLALDQLDLAVEASEVYGYLGQKAGSNCYNHGQRCRARKPGHNPHVGRLALSLAVS